MRSLKNYEKLFENNGWDKYLSSLYDWYMKGKDIEELLRCITKIEDKKKPLPNIKLFGEGEIKCDLTGCSIEAPKSTKVFVGAPKGYKPMYDGKRAWVEQEVEFDDETEQE